MEAFRNWYRSSFHASQALLLIQLLVLLGVVLLFGDILVPILISILLAYALEGVIRALTTWVPRAVAFVLVYVLFLAAVLLAVFRLIPLLSKQLADLVEWVPGMVRQGQEWLRSLPEQYPGLIDMEQIEQFLSLAQLEVLSLGEDLLQFSLNTAVDVFTLAVYVFLVPIMVFFLLKDKDRIRRWLGQYLPAEGSLSRRVGQEMNQKVARYMLGKLYEILIIWSVTFIVFTLFGLRYSLLLSFLVGLSVIIPYVGAVAVTIPVVLVALYQWGLTPDFAWLMLAYLIVQFLDGNMLVPVLFSEVINIHPVVILGAILLFGGCGACGA